MGIPHRCLQCSVQKFLFLNVIFELKKAKLLVFPVEYDSYTVMGYFPLCHENSLIKSVKSEFSKVRLRYGRYSP